MNVSISRGRVNAIRNAKGLGNLTFPMAGNFYDDGTLRYTEYTSGGHSIWGSVYAEPSALALLVPVLLGSNLRRRRRD